MSNISDPKAIQSSDLSVKTNPNRLENIGNGIAIRDHRLLRRTNAQVVMSLIAANTSLAVALCTGSGPIGCAVAVAVACMANFFTAWFSNSLSAASGTGDRAPAVNLHAAYISTEDCSFRCQFDKQNEGVAWAEIGNTTTADGIYHTMYHYISGHIRGIRAVQAPQRLNKRQDQYDEGGFVGNYYWTDNQQTEYSILQSDSSDIEELGNAIGTYMVDNNAIAACADLQQAWEDGSAPVDGGLFTLGWNDQHYYWDSEDQLDADMSQYCLELAVQSTSPWK
jgi:hypothetical protein